jgi:RES domain-containing protein
LAMIEYFVHLDRDDPPPDLVVAAANVPDDVSRVTVSPGSLPATWRQTPAPRELAAIGDRFARRRRDAILIVPSALAPDEANWLLNPDHSDFTRIRIHSPEPFTYDTRFFT